MMQLPPSIHPFLLSLSCIRTRLSLVTSLSSLSLSLLTLAVLISGRCSNPSAVPPPQYLERRRERIGSKNFKVVVGRSVGRREEERRGEETATSKTKGATSEWMEEDTKEGEREEEFVQSWVGREQKNERTNGER